MEPLEIVPERYIGEGFPCFIVAEISQNHQGNLDIAKELIREAKANGADCVKLQKSCLNAKFTSSALDRVYDSPNSFGATYGEHKSRLEFSEEEIKDLQEYAREVGIPLSASAMDIPSLEFLESLNLPFLKIGSGDVHNLQLIRKAASFGRPLIISTGMSDIAWISEVYRDITNYMPSTPIVLLQCTSAYPTPSAHVHLRVMDTYAQMFPRAHIGYSGHELGIHISVAAVAKGARVLERHFTLNKEWKGSDHVCSLDPNDLRELVSAIRSVEEALGSPLKTQQSSEDACYHKLGKSVVATRNLIMGTNLQEEDLTVKVSEPAGLSGTKFYDLLGKTLKRDVSFDSPLTEYDVSM